MNTEIPTIDTASVYGQHTHT